MTKIFLSCPNEDFLFNQVHVKVLIQDNWLNLSQFCILDAFPNDSFKQFEFVTLLHYVWLKELKFYIPKLDCSKKQKNLKETPNYWIIIEKECNSIIFVYSSINWDLDKWGIGVIFRINTHRGTKQSLKWAFRRGK